MKNKEWFERNDEFLKRNFEIIMLGKDYNIQILLEIIP